MFNEGALKDSLQKHVFNNLKTEPIIEVYRDCEL